jgi:hypothetical protein
VPGTFGRAEFTLPAVVADLERALPRYVIFERIHTASEPGLARRIDDLPNDPLLRRLLEQYVRETDIEDFSLYRLKSPGSSR